MTKLTELCDILYGYAFDSGAFTDDDSYPQLVRIRDVKRGYSETFYNGEFPEEYVLSAGDLLVGMDGEFNIARWKVDGALLNQRVCKIIAKHNTDEEYLRFALSKALKGIEDRTSFVTVKHLSAKELNKLEIPVPSYDEQKRISEILHRLEIVIEFRQTELDSLDTLIKARFVEMFGDVRENPNKYDIVPFIDIVQYMGDIGSNGANKVVVDHLDMKDEEDYAMMVRFTNFTKNDFTDDVKYVSKEAYDFFKKSQIFGGELIICKIGSAGQNYVMPYLNRPVSLGLNQIMVRIKGNILMSYLYQYLHTDYGEFLISGCINGAVTKTITKTELKKIPVILPPMELQKEFESFVQQVDKSKVVFHLSHKLQRRLRTWLTSSF